MSRWLLSFAMLLLGCAGATPTRNLPNDRREFSLIGDAGTISPDNMHPAFELPDLAASDGSAQGFDLAGQCATVDVVINEVQTDGSTGTDEFIELYNPCGGLVDLTGYKVVYRAAQGTADLTVATLAQSIGPLGYLVLANSGFGGTSDVTVTAGLSKSGGGLAFKDPAGVILDSLGWGNATNAFIEGTVADLPPSFESIARTPNGQDSDQNHSDFVIDSTPSPRAPN